MKHHVGLLPFGTTTLCLPEGTLTSPLDRRADLLHTNFKFGRWFKLEQWYLILVSSTMIIGTASVAYFEKYGTSGLDFLFISALMGGFAMAVYVPLLLYMNLKYLPKSAKPGVVTGLAIISPQCAD